MFGLRTTEIVIVLVIVVLMAAAKRIPSFWDDFKNGGGPFDGGDGFEFQPINSNSSQLSRCHNCGAQTKDSYENCPVCGEKTGETLAVTKTFESAVY